MKVDLVNQFKKSAVETGSTIECINRTPELLDESLNSYIENRIVLLGNPEYIEPSLFSIYKSKPNVISNPAKVLLTTINTGITDSICGIASTGSVCIPITRGVSSLISMLVYDHIVILDSNKILSRPKDLFSKEITARFNPFQSFSIITGPSATADMGPLVRGAHGPGKLHIIILN